MGDVRHRAAVRTCERRRGTGRIHFVLFEPLPLAIAAGLFIGKQLGVFGAIWLADRTGVAPRPAYARWVELYGASLLCGVGFTMSLFIGALAFPDSPEAVEAAKIGTLVGSLLSAFAGWAILRSAKPIVFSEEDTAEAREIFGDDQYEKERHRRESVAARIGAANRPPNG
jgi:Na+:H+ antiporter, NhaA family